MSGTQTYRGGCHCGAVAYEAEIDLSAPVMECNCSHCAKKGFLLAFTPATRFTLVSGHDALTEYRFNTGKIAHVFCSTCGVQSFGRGVGPDGTDTRMVNVRCLEGVDVTALTITPVDGRSY